MKRTLIERKYEEYRAGRETYTTAGAVDYVNETLTDEEFLEFKGVFVRDSVSAIDRKLNKALPKGDNPRQIQLDLMTEEFLTENHVSIGRGERKRRGDMMHEDVIHVSTSKIDKGRESMDAGMRELDVESNGVGAYMQANNCTVSQAYKELGLLANAATTETEEQ